MQPRARKMSIALVLLLIIVGAATIVGCWRYGSSSPKKVGETVELNAGKRQMLDRLQREKKFEPHDYPPLGYMGLGSPEEGPLARSAVNAVIDAILSCDDGPIDAATVSDLIRQGLKRLTLLDTEDRDRAADYMIEIWYILGFKGATGLFDYGSGFPLPEGYGEPLPPGWKSPTEPRPFGRKQLSLRPKG